MFKDGDKVIQTIQNDKGIVRLNPEGRPALPPDMVYVFFGTGLRPTSIKWLKLDLKTGKKPFHELTEAEQDALIASYGGADEALVSLAKKVYIRLHPHLGAQYLSRYKRITGIDLVPLKGHVLEITKDYDKQGGNIEITFDPAARSLLPPGVKMSTSNVVSNTAFGWALVEKGLRVKQAEAA